MSPTALGKVVHDCPQAAQASRLIILHHAPPSAQNKHMPKGAETEKSAVRRVTQRIHRNKRKKNHGAGRGWGEKRRKRKP